VRGGGGVVCCRFLVGLGGRCATWKSIGCKESPEKTCRGKKGGVSGVRGKGGAQDWGSSKSWKQERSGNANRSFRGYNQ